MGEELQDAPFDAIAEEIGDIPEELATIWSGPEVLRPFLRKIAHLHQLGGNHREHNVPILKESLTRSGQYVPFIVQEHEDGTATILVGNGRTKAALELGWTHVAVWPQPVTDEDEAALFALVDNISHDAGRTLFEHIQPSIFDDAMAAGLVEFEEFTRAKTDLVREAHGTGLEHEFAETSSEAAERARTLAESQRMKEAVMTMPIPEYERLGSLVRTLMPHYNTRGLTDTVMEALTNEVRRVEGEES